MSSPLSFRTKLLLAMMLVVSAITALGLYLATRNVAADAERDLRRDFQSQLTAIHRAEEIRHAALAETCRTLVAKPRLHAALEDNALDLLYPSAKDELRDLMVGKEDAARSTSTQTQPLHATFYRFLDRNGAVILPRNAAEAGALSNSEERALNFPELPAKQQIGYIWRNREQARETIDEVIAMPIVSSDTAEVISALVVGFKPVELESKRSDSGIKSGIWLNGRLRLPALSAAAQATLGGELSRAISSVDPVATSFQVNVDGARYLLFHKKLNPDSRFPAAHEICIYPLEPAFARQRRLQWSILGAGAALLLFGFIGSQFAAARLSKPVEKLAVESEANRVALGSTRQELQRSERFSANASHQLKSPVAVLRAGIESLLNREGFAAEVYDELSSMLHQTYRLTGVIDDLLLLSRMDAGHLKIKFSGVNLTEVIEEWIEDLSALPDALEVKIEKEIPADLYISGERRYASLVVQNLLENARKYNRPGGRIRVLARREEDKIYLCVGNTGRTIPPAAQQHIFERFHRAAVGENVPGHGLGLNLARDLVRLHGGELRLARSENDWTEFEVCFRAAQRNEAAPARST